MFAEYKIPVYLYMYSIIDFSKMIADKTRTTAYTLALQELIDLDSVVLDLGSGTGFFALYACQLGARKVYCIEPNEAIGVAREMASLNGYRDQITFIEDISTQVDLPEKVNLMISDLRGILPLYHQHIPTIIDARTRFLATEGCLIPQQDKLWATVVEAPLLYRDFDQPWGDEAYGLNMAATRKRTINSWGRGENRIKPEQFLCQPQSWGVLDYRTIKNSNIRGDLAWRVTRTALAHGVSVWFETTLSSEVHYSTAPGKNEKPLVYGNAFFPWESPVDLVEGDRVSVSFRADLVSDRYIWRWDTQISDRNDPKQIKANFRQSSFYSKPLSLNNLRKSSEDYVPSLNGKGGIDLFILENMKAQLPLKAIATNVWEKFPHNFRSYEQVLNHVVLLCQRYSE